MSVFTAATTAAVAALAGVAAEVKRGRFRPISTEFSNAVAVRPGPAEVIEVALAPGMPTGWRFVLFVGCYQRVGASASADLAIDPLVSEVYARLMADPTLGGTAYAIEPASIDPDSDVESEVLASAVLTFSILLRSPGATL